MRKDFRLAVRRIRLQLGGTRPDGCRAISCNSRAARIVLANHPDTITSLTARSRAAGSDLGGRYNTLQYASGPYPGRMWHSPHTGIFPLPGLGAAGTGEKDVD